MADVVVLADIYAAREKNTFGISSRDIEAKLKEKARMSIIFLPLQKLKTFY